MNGKINVMKINIKKSNTLKYEYEMLKVGDADAILIRHFIGDEAYVVLIDAGNASASTTIKNHIKKYFDTTNIDLAICTHPDSDHKDGYFDLLADDEITISEFWLTDPASYIDEYDIERYSDHDNAIVAVRKIWNKSTDDNLNLIELAIEKCGINNVKNIIDGVEHQTLPIKCVGPTYKYYLENVKQMVEDYNVVPYDDSSKEDYDEAFKIDDDEIKSVIDKEEDPSPYNASSLILLYEPGDGKRLLFAGDANTTSLQMMLDKYPWLRNVTMLKAPHHGSKRNLNTKIIDALAPAKTYVSAAGNKKHPSGRLLYWLAKHGDVFSTHSANVYVHCSYGDIPKRKGAKPLEPTKKCIK